MWLNMTHGEANAIAKHLHVVQVDMYYDAYYY